MRDFFRKPEAENLTAGVGITRSYVIFTIISVLQLAQYVEFPRVYYAIFIYIVSVAETQFVIPAKAGIQFFRSEPLPSQG